MQRRAYSDRRALMQSGAPVTPLTVFGSSLIAWHVFDRGVTLGTPPAVAAVADQGTKGNAVAQSTTTLRPSLTSTGFDFDGTDDNLSAASNASLDSGASLTVAIRVIPDVATSNRVPYCRSQSTSGSWSIQTNAAGLRMHLGTPGVNFGEVASALAAGVERTFVWVFDGSQTGNANRLKCYRDGVAQTVSFTGTIPATVPPSSNTLSIGCFSGPSGQYWDGKIKCTMAANAVASDAQRALIEAYMRGL